MYKMEHEQLQTCLQFVTPRSANSPGDERQALVEVSPRGFHLRNPPKPHELIDEITREEDLFQTIHFGPAVVDREAWKLVVDGMVKRPFEVDWSQLTSLPRSDLTSFHECYGSPVKPPTTNLWRIGNVKWTGVRLDLLLQLADCDPEARYVWSDGLENGSFFEAKDCDRYQKDLPLGDPVLANCLVAYEMNGEPIGRKRGGPVRLIVPGFYGTNSTKWLCRLSVQACRSPSPFTTIYYNEIDPRYVSEQRMRPCWHIEPNSFLLLTPSSAGTISGPSVKVDGRAWGNVEIEEVWISLRDEDARWVHSATAKAVERKQNEWQYYSTALRLQSGTHFLMAQAIDKAGCKQPVDGRRNHAHVVQITVV